jgi:5-methylcytosine-specific restriction endonuclease McrA
VNSCIGCTGRKQSSWLISFIDAEAMGLPAGWHFGKLCKAGHRWEGQEMCLKNRDGKCVECARLKSKSPRHRAYHAQWRANNKDRIKEASQQRNKMIWADSELRAKELARKQQARMANGRESQMKGLNGLVMPYGRGLKVPEARVVRQLVARGHPVDWSVLEPMVVATLQIQEAIKDVGKSPTVAQLVEAEQRQHWQKNPDDYAAFVRGRKRERHKWKYLTQPEYRLYHRQKSKRRKALMRNSVAIQVTGRVIKARFAEFGHRCAYCGAGGDLHIEHVVPISKGGGHAIGNIVPACESCNYSKRDHNPDAWYISQSFYSEVRWRKICRVLGWQRSSVGQLALL